ncbi:1-phosphofructokinase [Tepidanaerobacter sp. EBM-38]|uniref:1-phosphofructokinase n=1 Tax=Tepidanaerobacter sp. EBM-38 TaxID=1918496 RepID=UPI0025F83CE7|nr:1-phosphofructokinase [Tepidanaerobacter sp. EBM-38]
MQMVITVTLNPALDRTLNVDNFTIGTVNRVTKARYDIGGKGINVSKVLKNFNIDSLCLGFLGGIWEDYFLQELKRRKISSNFTHIDEDTRTNTKVVDTLQGTFTDINEAGPDIKKSELERFMDTFEDSCKNGDIVILSGGVSPSVPSDIYGKLIKIAKEKRAITILDAEEELLKEGVKAQPDMIKPNIHELAKLVNLDDDTDEAIIEAAKELVEYGIKKVLVSLGERGAIYVTGNGAYKCDGLKVPVKSTVGAGDSMVAALAYSLINDFGDEYTLKFANACGAATVMLEGTEACTLEQVKELVDDVFIKEEKH